MPLGDKTWYIFIPRTKKLTAEKRHKKEALGGKIYFNATLKIKLLDRTCNQLTALL